EPRREGVGAEEVLGIERVPEALPVWRLDERLVELSPQVADRLVRLLGPFVELPTPCYEFVRRDPVEQLVDLANASSRHPALPFRIAQRSQTKENDDDDDEGRDALEPALEQRTEVRPEKPEELIDAEVAHGSGPFTTCGGAPSPAAVLMTAV